MNLREKPLFGIALGLILCLTMYFGTAFLGAKLTYKDDPKRKAYDAVVKAAKGVCSGSVIASAAEYRPTGNFKAVYPLVIGERKDFVTSWSEMAYDWGWTVAQIEDVQLVACVQDTFEKLDSCHYTNEGILDRIVNVVRARIVEARTGNVVSTQTFTGTPPECKQNLAFKKEVKDGKAVDSDLVKKWLASKR